MIDTSTLAAQLTDLVSSLVATLVTHLDGHASLSQHETRVRHWGADLTQQTLTHILAWQSQVDGPRPACRQCAQPCQWHGTRTTTVLTLLGPIPVTRRYAYCAPCHVGFCPLDAVLGTTGTRTSLGVQREASYLAALLTYAEAATTLTRAYPLTISPCQVETLTAAVGHAMVGDEDQQVQAVWTTPAPTAPGPDRLYVSMDGVLARVRRAAAERTPDEEERAGDVYREVKVATIWASQSGRTRSHLAPTRFVDTVTQTWYRARRTTAEAFGPQVYAAAVAHGVATCPEVVVLGDGAAWIWNLATEQFPGATQIVDVWHAQQYLWEVARTVYGSESAVGQRWVQRTVDLLLQGDLPQVIARLQALATVPLTPGVHLRTPTTAVGYFQTHAARMRYPEFRAHGFLIGSGPAEAGCKCVVTTRLKRAGMRWSLAGLDALLPIRTAVLNGTFDSWWHGHQQTLIA